MDQRGEDLPELPPQAPCARHSPRPMWWAQAPAEHLGSRWGESGPSGAREGHSGAAEGVGSSMAGGFQGTGLRSKPTLTTQALWTRSLTSGRQSAPRPGSPHLTALLRLEGAHL